MHLISLFVYFAVTGLACGASAAIDDERQKTSVNFITHPKEKHDQQKPAYITRYGPKGFVVHGSRVLGSLAILPGLFLNWKVCVIENSC